MDDSALRSSLRSRPAIFLIAATLLTSLTLGVAFVVAHRIYDLRGAAVAPVEPLSDDQARQQVLESARLFVGAGRMTDPAATYLLMSCPGDGEPPYQGNLYLNFAVPTIAETPAYFRRIAGAMKERGWLEGLPPGRNPGGRTLAKDGVTAVYYRDSDLPERGVLQISGECRIMSDHRFDDTGFVDVTGELRP